MSFECPICMKEFDTEKCIAKLLKCGDTICIICLNDILKRKNECPICRAKINEGIEILRNNRYAYNAKNKIICELCLEEFDTNFNSEKVPKVLKCGDTFCFNCILKLTKSINENEICCPTCMEISKEKWEDMPVNKLAIELFEQEKINNIKFLNEEDKNLPESPDYQFSVGLLGESGVGKTYITHYFYKGESCQNSLTTIGFEFHYKLLTINDLFIKIRLYDTCGQERYRSLAMGILRGVDGVAIVFSLAISDSRNYEQWKNADKQRKAEIEEEYKKEAFTKVRGYYKQYSQIVNIKEKILYLIGNKVDDVKNRVIKKEDALDLANELKVKYFETSAISGENINNVFKRLFLDLYNKNKKNDGENPEINTSKGNIELKSNKPKNKKKCCLN